MPAPPEPDLLIFGGGIAGLWTLLRARRAGHSALLLESRALGGVQSIASQGIIHGGTKYALTGKLSAAARAIGEMPGRWRDCLAGRGELDLSAVRLLSSHQYLWSSGDLVSSLAGFFGSRAMRSRVTPVAGGELPPPFDDPLFRGALYRLEEPVLDTASLMAELAAQAAPWCYAYEEETLAFDNGQVKVAGMALKPRRVLFAAGAGNENLLQAWGARRPRMQRRPLHMVMVRGRLPAIYAHALGASANPRLTITSYPLTSDDPLPVGRASARPIPGKTAGIRLASSPGGTAVNPSMEASRRHPCLRDPTRSDRQPGADATSNTVGRASARQQQTIWYLGGDLAEKGISRSREAQIEKARQELTALLPWLDLDGLQWSTLRIDRAEVATPGGRRPDDVFLGQQENLLVAWPTKLAFAPRLADRVLEVLGDPSGGGEALVDLPLPRPPLAPLPWEKAKWL